MLEEIPRIKAKAVALSSEISLGRIRIDNLDI
jgi:hypothetical protein